MADQHASVRRRRARATACEGCGSWGTDAAGRTLEAANNVALASRVKAQCRCLCTAESPENIGQSAAPFGEGAGDRRAQIRGCQGAVGPGGGHAHVIALDAVVVVSTMPFGSVVECEQNDPHSDGARSRPTSCVPERNPFIQRKRQSTISIVGNVLSPITLAVWCNTRTERGVRVSGAGRRSRFVP